MIVGSTAAARTSEQGDRCLPPAWRTPEEPYRLARETEPRVPVRQARVEGTVRESHSGTRAHCPSTCVCFPTHTQKGRGSGRTPSRQGPPRAQNCHGDGPLVWDCRGPGTCQPFQLTFRALSFLGHSRVCQQQEVLTCHFLLCSRLMSGSSYL